uniref:Uncharacterized protein n=1 Tax=Arundo donax TaxID=35708 RepID=A0A0A9F6S3_ARUDO
MGFICCCSFRPPVYQSL